jgi:fucose 4-O-acetylase-like acetyltransferase
MVNAEGKSVREMTARAKARIAWGDQAKGLGIFLVVLAHVGVDSIHWVWNAIGSFIFLFHMPFFFTISGFFYEKSNPVAVLRRRCDSLIVPYCAFLLLLGAGPLIRNDGVHSTMKFLGRLAMGGAFLDGRFGVFWFVTCLVATQFVFSCFMTKGDLERPFSRAVLLPTVSCAIIGALLGATHLGIVLPFALEVVPMAILFFWFGTVYRHSVGRFSLLKAACCVIGASGLVALCGYGRVFSFDMKHSNYGPPILGVSLALSLSLVTIELVRLIPASSLPARVLSSLGEASLVIMFLHQAFHLSFQALGVKSDFLLLAVSVALPYLLYQIARRNSRLSGLFLGKRQIVIIENAKAKEPVSI